MTDKKITNARCKAKRPLNKKTIKGANKGRMVRRLKGPTKVTIPPLVAFLIKESTKNPYSIEG